MEHCGSCRVGIAYGPVRLDLDYRIGVHLRIGGKPPDLALRPVLFRLVGNDGEHLPLTVVVQRGQGDVSLKDRTITSRAHPGKNLRCSSTGCLEVLPCDIGRCPAVRLAGRGKIERAVSDKILTGTGKQPGRRGVAVEDPVTYEKCCICGALKDGL